jgi:hypothetical protein
VGVSKHEWKDWHDAKWVGSGASAETKKALEDALDELIRVLSGDDADAFVKLTAEDGNFKEAATKASWAASDAYQTIDKLRLSGKQRTFANKSAIEASDAAADAVSSYNFAASMLQTDLVRGLVLENAQVAEDPANFPAVKSSDLASRLKSSVATVSGSFDDADAKVQALLAVTKIGIV